MKAAHYIEISHGALDFSPADEVQYDPDLDEDHPDYLGPASFDHVDEAADYIAKVMIKSKILYMLHSSSCDFPDEYGWDDFDLGELEDKIQERVVAAGL